MYQAEKNNMLASYSASPTSIARKSTDFRQREKDTMRKQALLANASSSLELSTDSADNYANRSGLSIEVPVKGKSVSRDGSFFLQLDLETEEVVRWPPVSPTDLSVSSPDDIMRENYRRRFFEEVGLHSADVEEQMT